MNPTGKKMKAEEPVFYFFQISSEPDLGKVRELFDVLKDGGEIISAVGQAHSVQYILKGRIR